MTAPRRSHGIPCTLLAAVLLVAAPIASPGDAPPCKPGAALDVTFEEIDTDGEFVEVAFEIRPLRALRDVSWELELWGTVSLVEGLPRELLADGTDASRRLLLRAPADGTHKTAELVVRGTFDGAGRDGWRGEETVVAARTLEWERPSAFLPRLVTRDASTGLPAFAERVPSSWAAPSPGTPPVPGPVATAGTFLVTGSFFYEDKGWGWSGWTGQTPLRPVRRADVTVLDDATGAVLGTGSTAQDGSFAVTCTAAGPVDVVARCAADTSLAPGFQPVSVWPPSGFNPYVVQGPVFPGHDGLGDLDVGSVTALMTKVGNKDGNPFNIFDVSVSAWEWLLGPDVQAGVAPPVPGPDPVHNIWPWPTTFAQPWGAVMGDDDAYDDAVILHELGHVVQAQYSKISAGAAHSFGDSDQDPRTSFMEGFATTFTGLVLADMGRRPIYVDSQGNASQGGAKLRLNIETAAPYAAGALGCSDEVAVCCALFDVLDDSSTPDATPGVDDDAFDGGLLVAGQGPVRAFWELFTGEMTHAYRLTHNDTWESWASVYRYDPSTEALRALCADFGQIFSEDTAEPDDSPERASMLPTSAAWSGPFTLFSPQAETPSQAHGDQDWFAHELVKGSVVTFETRYPGGAPDANTQVEPQLELFDPEGTLVATDTDSGVGRNARIGPFTVPETGTWRVRVSTQLEGWPLWEEEFFRRYGLYEYRASAVSELDRAPPELGTRAKMDDILTEDSEVSSSPLPGG